MRLLLDTHVFLWLNSESKRLGDSIALIDDRRNELLLSAVSAWEIAIKYALGKLPLPEPPARYVPSRMRAVQASGLAVEIGHGLAVAQLPLLHRDPFDRLLLAQAMSLDVPILTADPVLAKYPVQTVLVGSP